MKTAFCAGLLLPCISAFFLHSDVKTVPSLDVQKYLGKWYQMYCSESVSLWFEKGATCVTAEYALANDGTKRITVLNSQQLANGDIRDIHGYATPSDKPGILSVSLEGVPVSAPYWVIKLGPVGKDGKYEYSVVTDNLKATLFVLVRDPEVFRQEYDAEVTQFLKDQGFTSIVNKPVVTYQGPKCKYSA